MAKILVVEDDQILSTMLVRSLEAEHFEVHAADDGVQGVLEIRTWHPDLVLLDLLMPNKDGLGVLTDIRSDPETMKTHVIVFSNVSASETIAQVKKFGVTEYFIKANTTPREIVAKVKELFS